MRKYLSCLIFGIGLAFSGIAAAAQPVEYKSYHLTVMSADISPAAAVLPSDDQTEAMASLSAAESIRAALVARLWGSTSTGDAVPYESVSQSHTMALRHYTPADNCAHSYACAGAAADPGDENEGEPGADGDAYVMADPEDKGDGLDETGSTG